MSGFGYPKRAANPQFQGDVPVLVRIGVPGSRLCAVNRASSMAARSGGPGEAGHRRNRTVVGGTRRWFPVEVLGGIGLVAVLLALADPDDASGRLRVGVVAAWLACLVLVGCGGWMIVLRWRLMRRIFDGWYAAAATSFAVYLVGFSVRLYDVQPSRIAGAEAVADVLMLVFWLMVLGAAARRAHLPRAGGPVVLGVGTGLVGVSVEVGAARLGPDVPSTAGNLVLLLALVPTALVCSAAFNKMPGCEQGTRRQLALAAVLALAARVLLAFSSSGQWTAALAAALAVTASAIFAVECTHLLLRDRHSRRPAAQPPAHTPDSAEALHELRASMAGVASAVHVLTRYGDEITPERRTELTEMLASEIARLERLLAREGIDPAREVDLDEVIDPVVTARRVTGQVIEWSPGGHRVLGGVDSIRAALNILLVNADIHAEGAPVTVSTEPIGDFVCIRVADAGPGIPEHVRGSIFDRGVRGDGSPGQGIGLSFARRLIGAQRGSLRLSTGADSGGACFEVLLPAPSTQIEAG